jgi:hypothetical protein
MADVNTPEGDFSPARLPQLGFNLAGRPIGLGRNRGKVGLSAPKPADWELGLARFGP